MRLGLSSSAMYHTRQRCVFLPKKGAPVAIERHMSSVSQLLPILLAPTSSVTPGTMSCCTIGLGSGKPSVASRNAFTQLSLPFTISLPRRAGLSSSSSMAIAPGR